MIVLPPFAESAGKPAGGAIISYGPFDRAACGVNAMNDDQYGLVGMRGLRRSTGGQG